MPEETYNIYDLLDKMREQPAMYLGVKSLIRLHAFVEGHHLALLERSVKDVSNPPFFAIEFFDWVAVKLGYHSSEMGWCNAILADTLGRSPNRRGLWRRLGLRGVKPMEDAAALDRFYELLDEYRRNGPMERDAVKAKMLIYQDDWPGADW